MVNLSAYPVSIDGVRLDTLAWGIEASSLRIGGLRSADVVLAGLDGVVPSLTESREPSSYSLSMFVRGTDEDGLVPGGRQPFGLFVENLANLLHLFTRAGSLLDVREVVDEAGTVRQFYGKATESLEPEMELGAVGRFRVVIDNPGVWWQDVATQDWSVTNPALGTPLVVSTLTGSSAPVDDAVVAVKGPWVNPSVMDVTTGNLVRLGATLGASDVWRVNVGTWTSQVGALTVASADSAGLDRNVVTESTGAYPRLLRLAPARVSGQRQVRIQVGGSGTSSASTVTIRARRKHAR